MDAPIPEPTLFDDDGAPETVYLSQPSAQATEDGWVVSSLAVGSWQPMAVGDRIVALDQTSQDEYLVEVIEVVATGEEVFYSLRHLADLDPSSEPSLDDTRPWLPSA